MARTVGRILVAAGLAVAVACGPAAPPPSGGGVPTGDGIGFTRFRDDSRLEQFIDSWATDDWYAHVRFHSDVVGGVQQPGTTEVRVFPRSGPSGLTLGVPQVLPLPALSNFAPLWGESFLGVQTATTMEFWKPVAGVWNAAGSLTLPVGHSPMAMSDRWLVLRNMPMDEFDVGQILVYELSDVGGSIVASPHSTLDPDPAWPSMVRNTFGFRVDLDGDLLALSAIGTDPSEDLIQVHGNSGPGWPVVFTFDDPAATTRFAEAVAVSDGALVDRVAFARGLPGGPGQVDVWADAGSGFGLEEVVGRPSGLPGDTGSSTFGFSLDLDGDVLAVASRVHTIAVPGIDGGEGTAGVVDVFRQESGWRHDSELRPWNVPSTNDMDSTLPWAIEIEGGHVAVTVLGSPSPGCGFLCINLGFESWLFDSGA